MASLEKPSCRARQERFRERLRGLGIDGAVVSDLRDIYYFTGHLGPPKFPACLVLETGGRSWLFAHNVEGESAADECLTYPWETFGTVNTDLIEQLGRLLGKTLKGAFRCGRLGWQTESLVHHLAGSLDDALHPDNWSSVDADLLKIQQRKDPDELALIREAVRADLAAYDAVQAAILPGVTEAEVLAAGTAAAIVAAGEKVQHDGDYRSGQLGGSARDRPIEAGELYIVDAWTCYRGYWSDLSRTFIVGGEPTALQQSLYDHIAGIQRAAPGILKPGIDGSDVWRRLDRLMREFSPLMTTGLIHHGGHAIGLRAHEMPDLNPDRGGVVEPGMVICVEPGAYLEEARHGVRLENMYLITDTGCENLSEYPLEIVAGGRR